MHGEKQKEIVLERSARFNLNPGRVTRVTKVMDDHLQEAGPSG